MGNYRQKVQHILYAILAEVVYIATIHPFHYEHTKLALNAGKHVLCEKPMALNVKQAEEMLQLAKEKGLFFMEVV